MDSRADMTHGAAMSDTRRTSAKETSGPSSEGHVRLRLLKAATRLLSEAGVEGATARAICAMVGVKAPTLYHYFGDLSRLHAAAVNAAFLTVAAEYRRESRSGGPLNGVRQAWLIFMQFARREPRITRLLIARVLNGQTPPAVQLTLRQVQGDLEKLDAQGKLAAPAAKAIRILWTAAIGAASLATTRDDPENAEALLDAVLSALAPSFASANH